MSQAPAPELLRAPEVARLLDVSVGYIYKLANDGRLESVKLGKSVRFRRDVVDRVLSEGIPSENETAS